MFLYQTLTSMNYGTGKIFIWGYFSKKPIKMEDLNIKHQTTTFLDITQEKIYDLGFGSDFLQYITKSTIHERKIDVGLSPEIENSAL